MPASAVEKEELVGDEAIKRPESVPRAEKWLSCFLYSCESNAFGEDSARQYSALRRKKG